MGKRSWAVGVAIAALMAGGVAQAGEAGDLLRTHLYDGTLAEGLTAVMPLAEAGDPEAEFAAGVLNLALGVEGFAQDLYRHGATAPDTGAALMLFGIGQSVMEGPANPNPEPLTYETVRTMLSDLVTRMDAAKALLAAGGESGDYVVAVDPLLVRIDLNGDGTADEAESVGALLAPFLGMPAPVAVGGKIKNKTGTTPDTSVGLDRADAYWLAGYSQVIAAQADFMLAHDFEEFVNAYFHRIFPRSGLPMQDFAPGGSLIMDPETDVAIADIVAALHTMDFPVTDAERLKGVLARLQSITAFSRLNWEAILAETDDNRELVPSPKQTAIIPEGEVTEETVSAWMETLDTIDKILGGELLIPHWRFKQGFDLKAYFETAKETDLVMIMTGYGALPFLKDGPVADAESFAAANRVFGEQWIGYAFWFN